ncbi:MAG TPA: SusC/RagA family TonB-linked outer membrane protein [Chitinophagaceae bacterium]|nr:SusC/RagA family TonB-linked outer membrane protein [Chitinophagaceae bacterium]
MRKFLTLLTVLLLSYPLLFAQNRTVSGKVTDEKGEPVAFASVKIKGTKKGTAADAGGLFSISVDNASEAVLVISSQGFETKEVLVGSLDFLNVSLKQIVGQLQEVVVTTGLGIKRQSREVGYSTASIGSNELNQAKVLNAATGLTGKVSGLQIQTGDNSVNPQVRVTLRGNRSILGNNQALIVVDGILVDNNFLARMNPNDIENINILKGASASAIYGSEASNGVFVITTRKGTRAKPRIQFSSTAQLETVSYLPKLQDRFGSYGGESFNQLLGIIFPEDPFKIYFPYENQSYGPEYNGQLVPLGGPVTIFRPDGTSFDSTRYVPYSAVKNGKRKFFDKGLTLQNNVSFSSGDANSSFYFSFQNVRVEGVVPGDKSNRNTLRLNGSREYGRFKIDFNTSYSLEKIDQAGGSYFQNRPVYWTVINAPQHVNLRDFKNWKTDPFASPDGYFNAYYGNPWWQISEARNVDKSNFFVGNVKFTLDITDWLSASYNVGYTRRDRSFKGTQNGYDFADWAEHDPWEAGAIPSSVKILYPSLNEFLSQEDRINGDAFITANKNFGDFSTKLVLGNTIWKRKITSISDATSTLVFPGLFNINYRQGEPTVGQFIQEQGLIGAFADATIGYKDFLFLHASGRNDWTSKLAESNRSFFYPGVDAAFVFTDGINALKNNKILNYGKVRIGYAKVGQVSVDPYSLENVAVSGAGFPFGAQAGFTLSNQFNNPGLEPEFTKEAEVGIELGFLKNRINFSATYYDAKTTNQTIPAQISSATGYTSSVINLGSMTNKGVELDLKLTPFLNLGPVKWNVGANYAYNKNKVGDDLGGEISLGNSVFAIPGKAYPYIKESDWNRSPDGRIIVDRNTGFPSKASALVGFGTTIPPHRIGITTSFVYKSLTLNAVFDARLGAVIYNNIGTSLDFTGISWYSAQTGRQPFVIPNSVVDDGTGKYVTNTDIATIDANWRFWANTWNAVGSNYVNSSDFWKVREISLTYDFSKKLLSKLKIVQAASFTLSGRNLFMIRAKDNVWTDPEFSNAGTGNAVGLTNIFQTPPTRLFGATLNVTF